MVLRADRYLLCGAMGLDVLSNLVHMARSQGLYAIVDARCADPAVWLGGEVNADAVTVSPVYGAAAAGRTRLCLRWSARRSRVRRRCRTSWLGIAACFLAAGEQMAPPGGRDHGPDGLQSGCAGAAAAAEERFPAADGCSGEAASYAFDDFGRGAMVIDDALQYAEDVPAAMDDAVREMKHWVTVV